MDGHKARPPLGVSSPAAPLSKRHERLRFAHCTRDIARHLSHSETQFPISWLHIGGGGGIFGSKIPPGMRTRSDFLIQQNHPFGSDGAPGFYEPRSKEDQGHGSLWKGSPRTEALHRVRSGLSSCFSPSRETSASPTRREHLSLL